MKKWMTWGMLGGVLLPGGAMAQEMPCYADLAVPTYTSVRVGTEIGAARPASGGEEVELCSVSLGPGELTDSFQGLLRGAVGNYHVATTVLAVDEGGRAGLVLTSNARQPDAAHFYVAVERSADDGTTRLIAAVRPMSGGPSTPLDSQPVEVELPLTVRLTRHDGVLLASSVVGDAETVLLSIPIAGTDLAAYGEVGVMQAGDSPFFESTARLTTPALQAEFTPPATVDCVDETTLPQTGGSVTFTGFGLDQVTEAKLGETGVDVVSATEDTLTVQVPPAPVPLFGALSLTLGGKVQTTDLSLALGGQSFVRADLDADLDVDLDDLRALRRAIRTGVLPECRVAADVNADGRVDAADDTHLARFLNNRPGARPPAAPFPDAGRVPGLPACGLPAGPVVRRILDAQGRALAGPVAPGATLRIVGTNLPPNPVVRFGSVPTRVLPGATSTRLDVQLGAVPSAGGRCLVVQNASPAVAGRPQFGLAYGASSTERPDLCPSFTASRLGFATEAVAREDGSLFLPIDPQRLDPSTPLRVNVHLALPLVEGESRGPRSTTFMFLHNPTTLGGSAPVPYGAWLEALAAKTAEALGADDDCDCEAEVLPSPQDGGLWIKPCFTTSPSPPVPPPPAGTVPGGLALKAARPPLGAANAFAPPPAPSCAELGANPNAREVAWCHLAQITQIREELTDPINDVPEYLGLPAWESFRPIWTLIPGIDKPWHLDPREQTPADKRTLVEVPLAEHLMDRDYFNGCGIAARAQYCSDPKNTWMPVFAPGQRVVKTFWRTQGHLPESADLADFYSYVPPDMERQYLVGMHVSVGTGDGFGGDGYLTWATYWMPKPPGDTRTKSGADLDLDYNPHCFEGGPQDRPAELEGSTWGNFHMCVQKNDGQPCGNPWGPADECEAPIEEDRGCVGCHTDEATITWSPGGSQPGEPLMRMGWLVVPKKAMENDAQACMDVILGGQKKGKTPYESTAYCEVY